MREELKVFTRLMAAINNFYEIIIIVHQSAIKSRFLYTFNEISHMCVDQKIFKRESEGKNIENKTDRKLSWWRFFKFWFFFLLKLFEILNWFLNVFPFMLSKCVYHCQHLFLNWNILWHIFISFLSLCAFILIQRLKRCIKWIISMTHMLITKNFVFVLNSLENLSYNESLISLLCKQFSINIHSHNSA